MAGPGGKTVACEQTLLPIWHGITAVQVRTKITATAHISADLYGHDHQQTCPPPARNGYIDAPTGSKKI